MDRSLTDNPNLVDEIVCEVKSQGVFDQFRRNCIADVDTKPAYQNLRQRVENIVSNFLNEQVWRPDLNKNQLREKLRKHITEAGFLETGVERIVDQVVNPKINSVFLPKIEDISYKYLGIEKPKPSDEQTLLQSELCTNEDVKPKILPTDLDDLEAVSPDSTGSKKSFKDSTEELNIPVDSIKQELNDSIEKVDDDFESPAFEPLKGSLLTGSDSVNGEEDSKLSDISGLTSQDSVNSEHSSSEQQAEPEIKVPTIEVIEQPAVTQSQQVIPDNINQDSVLSQVSSNSHLSIVTDSNNKSSEVDICEEAQMPKFSENSFNNPDVDDKERKPLLTSFDIKQDEIKFEGTERRSSLHDLNDDIKMEEDVVMDELKDAVCADSVGDGSVKTESSSSCMDPIISETKDLSLKDDGRSNENEFKFEEPAVSVDTGDATGGGGGGSNQNPNDKHKSKDGRGGDGRKSDSKSEHKSHRRDKDKSSHHTSRDKHKDGDRKHSSSSSSKHSSSSSSGRKEHRSESRETKKSSDQRRDESSKSTDRSSGGGGKNSSSSHSSSRDKDSNHKSSRYHDDKHDKSFKDPTDKDKNRSRHDRSSSNKSRPPHHRDEKTKRRSHDDDDTKKKLEQESKSKSMDDDHAPHHEKLMERRSTDRDSDDGERGGGKPATGNQPPTEVGSVNSSAITTSSSSFSSTASSSCTDEQEKREATDSQRNAADSNFHTSSTDSDDNFVPASAPVVVDQILIGNDINLEMLMEANSTPAGEMDPVMSMLQQSLSDDSEMKIKKPKVASNIFEARKLMKVRKQMERDKKKRLEKLLVHSKQMVGSNAVDEQGVELEFSIMNSSAPSISSPIKPKEVQQFDGQQTAAPIQEKRNSGEFIIDMKEMEKQMKKKRPVEKLVEKPVVAASKFTHKFDEILSQIDKPRKRDSKGSTSPMSPIYERSPKGVHDKSPKGLPDRSPKSLHERSPKFEQRKFVREQSKECTVVDGKKATAITSPPRQREDKKSEKSTGRSQDGSKSRKDSISSKSPPTTSHSPAKMEQKVVRSSKSLDRKISHAAGSASTSVKHGSQSPPSKQSTSKQNKVDSTDAPKDGGATTSTKPEDSSQVIATADSDDDDGNGFCGFPVKESMYEVVLDYAKVKQILETKLNDRTLHVMNCDQLMGDIFSHHSANVFDVSGSEPCRISEKFPELNQSTDRRIAGPDANAPRQSFGAKNGVRATTQQHKLFIENNQFADNPEVKQMSRKRRTSGGVQGTAAKIVRLVDSDEIVETSPTPSEQSKENQVVHQIKKHNRTTDHSCTSNELEQPTGEKSESNKPKQRYTSDDLYKPRPILSRTRRRGIENGEI